MMDPQLIVHTSHLTMFVVDAQQDLVRFTCKHCGATSEPIDATQPLPDSFRMLPHVPSCLFLQSVVKTVRQAA